MLADSLKVNQLLQNLRSVAGFSIMYAVYMVHLEKDLPRSKCFVKNYCISVTNFGRF